MSSSQQSDQLVYSFLFIITPLQITTTKSIKNLKKSILLKLGNQTQKTSQLNKPIQIYIDVLYSKTLKKYCPIKGIIKIYDINLDGSEVISSVGGFQTEELLNQGKNNVTIQRDIGTSKLKMKIEIKNLGVMKGKSIEKKQILSSSRQKQTVPTYVSRSRVVQSKQQKPLANSRLINQKPINPPVNQTRISTAINNPVSNINNSPKTQYTNQPSSSIANQQQTKQVKAPLYVRRSANLSGSNVQMNNSSKYQVPNKIELKKKSSDILPNQSTLNKRYSRIVPSLEDTSSIPSQSQFSQTYLRQKQNEELGQQLIQQRRKYATLQQKMAKHNIKINSLKKKITDMQKEKDLMLYHFQKISDGLEMKGGRVWIQLNQKQKALLLKFKNKTFEKVFSEFIEFMVQELKQPRSKSLIKDQQLQTPPISFISSADKKSQLQLKHLNQQLTKKTNQIITLRSKQRQLATLQIKLKTKQKQYQQIQHNLKQIQILKKTLKQQNQYLKQKDQTMQQIISQKQNDIEQLRQQILDIEVAYKELQQAKKNDQCQIQQLKEEVSNLNETIDKYREKYGDLKNVKNRALENQLKECLMWIDQQTRELEISDFAEETQPSHSHNVSQIIKNIQFQGATREQMNSIKQQLGYLIKRIDNFLMK